MNNIEWERKYPGIDVGLARSASDLIAALRRSHSHWWENGRMPWVFRGHADESWRLLPSAWRSSNALMAASREEATKRFDATTPSQRLIWSWPPTNFQTGPASFGADDATLQRALTNTATAELLLVWDFALGCNELGLSTPLFNYRRPGSKPQLALVPRTAITGR